MDTSILRRRIIEALPREDLTVRAYYNVTTTSAISILYNTSNVAKMTIMDSNGDPLYDVSPIPTTYAFPSTGTWLVKYRLTDKTYLPTTYPPNTSDSGMFRNVTSLVICYLPSTAKKINHSFRGCTGLVSVNMENLTTVGHYSFDSCKLLTGDLELPALDSSAVGTTYPGIGTGAFGYTKFSRITDLGNVYYLGGSSYGMGCFNNMTDLTYAELPASFGKWDSHIFHGDKNLVTLICHATTPPVPTSNSAKLMGGAGYNANLKIYVPDNSVSAYQAATGWSLYSSIIHPISDL